MIPDGLIKGASILIVDDEPASVRLLERMLERAGYTDFTSTTDPREAVDLFRRVGPDLLLLDLHMPDVDGFELLDRFRSLTPEGTYLPILVLTADLRPEPRLRALLAGAKDFLTKPFDQFEVLLRIHNLLETRMIFRSLLREKALLEEARSRNG